MESQVDVLICGGGLSGLTLARQIRRDHPSLSVAVVEKTKRPLPEAGHKVGESSVELGSRYLERLGLRDYLHERHLIKFGLRFFPGRGERPLEERIEIGPINDPVITSYQIDRGRFESDLRDMVVEEDGVHLYEGATVKDVALNPQDEPHVIRVEQGGRQKDVQARWVVDATGRTGLLRGRLKLKRGGKHPASAGWFRVKGHVDITKMAPDSAEAWHQVPEAKQRWLSTNHLMGDGYWVWLIPLSSGYTSIGAVVHEEFHSFDEVRTLERVKAFIARNEPVLAKALEDVEILDFGCINQYCNTVARCWMPDRWALVGEAGAFTDPLYSPGTDYIALANSFTSELIRVDLEGGDFDQRVRDLNVQYRALVAGSIGVYRHAGPVYGHARAMATKIYYDNITYWSYPCQYFLQEIYKLSGGEHMPFTVVGARFVELSNRMQMVLRTWAELAPDRGEGEPGKMLVVPGYPSILIDAHCALDESLTPEETLSYMQKRLVQAEEVFSEIVFRILQELGPELGRTLLERVEADAWDLEVPASRLEAEALEGRSRRRAMSPLAQDVERSLGRPSLHPEASAAMALMATPAVAAAL